MQYSWMHSKGHFRAKSYWISADCGKFRHLKICRAKLKIRLASHLSIRLGELDRVFEG
jgi:hypothetical protein